MKCWGLLSVTAIEALGEVIRSGRLRPPYSAVGVSAIVGQDHAGAVTAELQELERCGVTAAGTAAVLAAVADERKRHAAPEDLIDLVTTGPEHCGVTNRDTSVVVRELFAGAQQSVLVVGYAVYQGQRVFSALADRMAAVPSLKVRMLLDIQRPATDTSMGAEIVRRFVDRFIRSQWPAERPLPDLHYYPQSLDLDPAKRASLHAKCVVVDRRIAFVSSANFTEAAQERNIEVGLLVRSRLVAERLARHFDGLVEEGSVVQLAFPGG